MRKLFTKSSLPSAAPLPASAGGGSDGGGPSAGGGGGASLAGNYSSFIGKQFSVCHHEVTVENVIAEGGFSIVFLVSSSSGGKLAMKRMFVNNDEDLHACRRELKISSTLSDHPHIIDYIGSSVNSCGDSVHEILLLMPYYRNSLLNLMNERLQGGFSESEVLDIFCDVCEAVSRLHHCQTPIIHRDLKVENVLITDNGTRVLCDFGSATSKELDPTVLPVPVVNEEIQRYTTPSYRAPEMVDLYSGYKLTTKTDIWALGCFLYKLCYFTLPFGDSALAIQSGALNFPDSPSYSAHVQTLIRYMLQVDPTIRPDIYQVTSLVAGLAGRACNVQNLQNSTVPDLATLSAHLTNPSLSEPIIKPAFTNTTVTAVSNNTAVAAAASATRGAAGVTVDCRDTPHVQEVSTSVAPRQRPKPSKTALGTRLSANAAARIEVTAVSSAAATLNGFGDDFAPPASAVVNSNINTNSHQASPMPNNNNNNNFIVRSADHHWETGIVPKSSTSASRSSTSGSVGAVASGGGNCFGDDFSQSFPAVSEVDHGASQGSLTSPPASQPPPAPRVRLQPPVPSARPTHRRNHSDHIIPHRVNMANSGGIELHSERSTDRTNHRIPVSLDHHQSEASCTADMARPRNGVGRTASNKTCWNPFESDFCPVLVAPPVGNIQHSSHRTSITDTNTNMASNSLQSESFPADQNDMIDDDPFGAAPFTMPASMRRNTADGGCDSDRFRRDSDTPVKTEPVAYTCGPIENRARYTKLTSDLSPSEHLELFEQQQKEANQESYCSDQSATGSVDSIGSATDLRSSYDSCSGSDTGDPSIGRHKSTNPAHRPPRGTGGHLRRRRGLDSNSPIDTVTVTGTVASSLYQAECESVADEAQAEGRIKGPGGGSVGISQSSVSASLARVCNDVRASSPTTTSSVGTVGVPGSVGKCHVSRADLLIGHQYGNTPLLEDDELSLSDYPTASHSVSSHTVSCRRNDNASVDVFGALPFTSRTRTNKNTNRTIPTAPLVNKPTPAKLGWHVRRPRFRQNQHNHHHLLLTSSHETLTQPTAADTEPLCPPLTAPSVLNSDDGYVNHERKAFTLPPRLYGSSTTSNAPDNKASSRWFQQNIMGETLSTTPPLHSLPPPIRQTKRSTDVHV